MVQLNENNSTGLPRMEALIRIANIPIVESGVKTAGSIYFDLKKRSGLLCWSFETAEGVFGTVIESVRPAVKIIEGPLQRFDQLLCSSLDAVEQRVPSIYLPPHLIYSNTKEYMSDVLVRPVLKRADSFKHIGTSVLDSRVSSYAANRIEGAIDVADKYVEKYLPSEDQIDSAQSDDDNENKAIHTFHKSQRFSRKLKRRLTQRTIAEARALKKQGKEAIHILIYAAELIATDPKLAMQKARELWAYLSKDEPENQARPQTIEELIILMTRESARRMVHLINYSGVTATKVPNTVRDLLHQFVYASDSLIRYAHLDAAKSTAVNEVYAMIAKFSTLYGIFHVYSSSALERLAYILAGRANANAENRNSVKKSPKHRYVINSRANNNPLVVNNANGAY